MPRLALLLSYDATAYRGWWRQPDGGGVADRLDAACRAIGEDGTAVGAARTDAGVHARGQVAHLDLVRGRDPAELPRLLNHRLPGDIACRAAAPVPDGWHAVHDATGKEYRYRLDVRPVKDPFVRAFTWRRHGLAIPPLQAAADLLVGVHDFGAFRRRSDHREDCRCALERIAWTDEGDELVCAIVGDRFIMRLVRSLVGLMVARATDQVDDATIEAALAGKVNDATRHQAPAHGLCLERVRYATEPPWATPT